MRSSIGVAALAAALIAVPAAGQDHSGHEGHGTPAATSGEQGIPPTSGEVRRVDKATNKITIRHAPIQNLGMPAMTMVFQVSDATLLNGVKAGDKVLFTADKKSDGSLVVTRITPER